MAKKEVLANGFMKEGTSVKLRYNLIPAEVEEELAKILTFGAAKYAPNNWKKCEDTTYYWDAMYRHLQQYRLGEVIDKESGFNHLSHALCNLMFLVYFERVKNGKTSNERTGTTSKDN